MKQCKLTQQAGFWTHASVSLVASVTCSMQHYVCGLITLLGLQQLHCVWVDDRAVRGEEATLGWGGGGEN